MSFVECLRFFVALCDYRFLPSAPLSTHERESNKLKPMNGAIQAVNDVISPTTGASPHH